MTDADRLSAVILDPDSFPSAGPELDKEREVAIRDLVADNAFRPVGAEGDGPWRLTLSLHDGRLALAIAGDGFEKNHGLSMNPLNKVMRDYLMICESYHEVLAGADAGKIEAIDMGRRGLHNEGSQTLMDRLDGKIEVDFDTARRLFTLVCVLHWRG